MFSKKNVDSLEGLIKSLSTMKNSDWNMAQWMMFIDKSKACVALVNELRDMTKFSEKVKENKEKSEEKEDGKPN